MAPSRIGKINFLILCLSGLIVCSLLVQQQVEGSRRRKHHQKDDDDDDSSYNKIMDEHEQVDDDDRRSRGGHKRIVGGQKAELGQFPFLAAMKKDTGKILCTAVIISDQHILTAGHCIRRDKRIASVFVGHVDLRHKGDDARDYQVANITRHEKYFEDPVKSISDDIAVIKIKGKFQFGRNVAKIDLPEQGKNYPDHIDCIQIGWGAIEERPPNSTKDVWPYELHLADMKTINIDTCSRQFIEFSSKFPPASDGDGKHIQYRFDPYDQICAKGDKRSPDRGDSGGPLVMRAKNDLGYELIGLCSDGHPFEVTNWPTVEVKVSGYTDWIKKTMEAMK